jgi:DNA primase
MIINNNTHFAGLQSEFLTNKKLQVNDIKQTIDPLDFYTHELGKLLVGRSGWIDAGVCPFHIGHIPGSFHVELKTGAFKCLSCEAKGHDLVDFTMLLHKIPLSESLKKLAYQWSHYIPLNESRPWGGEGRHHAQD